ncbi:MAG: choice-of-anchor D domain-containing protein [Armatimonadetes bacterium]|nr:choice-of-anchor D domain-containing protein [Anaerolineae bacterium]
MLRYRIQWIIVITIMLIASTVTVYAAGPEISFSATELVFSGEQAKITIPNQTLTITNTGTSALTITSVTLGGDDPEDFTLTGAPPSPVVLQPNGTLILTVGFNPALGEIAVLDATLTILSNDSDEGSVILSIYGLSAKGLEGGDEPALHRAMQTLGYNIDVGGTGLILGTDPNPIGDEVLLPLLRKATVGGVVTIYPIARWSPIQLIPYGYYLPNGANPLRTEVGIMGDNVPYDEQYPPNHQTLNPIPEAGTAFSFDPGTAVFGFFTQGIDGRYTYTQDPLNATNPTLHGARIYPAKDRAGVPIPNTYIVGFEDAANGDYQDYVFVIGNVMSGSNPPPGTATPTASATPTLTPSTTPTATSTATATATSTPTASATAIATFTTTPATSTPAPSATATFTTTPATSTATASATTNATATLTATNSATTAATATPQAGIELLVNASFEAQTEGNPLPDGWIGKGLIDDKRKCNKVGKVIARTGECAWRFKGGEAENASITQKPLPIIGMNAGDTLALTLYTYGKVGVLGEAKVTVKYTDALLAKSKLSLPVVASEGYVPLSSTLTLLGDPASLKLSVKHSTLSGKLLVDDASLVWLNGAAAASLLALP